MGDVLVTAGRAPEVRYELDDVERHVRVRLVVGADGRGSSVRRQLGIELEESVPRTMGAGMLVEGLHEWPSEKEAVGTARDIYFLIFARPAAFARLYTMLDIGQKNRFAGPNRCAEFLDAFRLVSRAATSSRARSPRVRAPPTP